MECQGCFICCDQNERDKYPIIQEIEIIGSELFNGTYKLTNFFNLKPQYKKIDDDVYFHRYGTVWILNDSLIYVTQNTKCPITQWEEKNNDYVIKYKLPVKIKTPFHIVTFMTDVKPAK